MSKDQWSIEEAIHTYQINSWSDGHFTINSKGHLCAKSDHKNLIDIPEVVAEMKEQNIGFPCVIRFQDIIRNQVQKLNETFKEVANEANFNGEYWGVYPIKVNQLREVVEEVVEAGSDYHYGLECGSKSELLAVLSYNSNQNSLTILNGYKDLDYMKLAMLGVKLKKNIVVVIEKLSEIYTLIKAADDFECIPKIGVRAKLNSKSTGKWTKSSGDKAKFGLSVSEILDLIKILKENNLLDRLELFHFHTGSQISDIRSIKECLNEGARIYTELKKIAPNLRFFDVGGGVGLNYDGSKSNCPSSINYTLKDYVGDVVYILKDICDQKGIDHPHIVSETGRAVSAHHSCVITNVFGKINNLKLEKIDQIENPHSIIQKMINFLEDLNHSNYQDVYNDAVITKDEGISAFNLGILTLKERSTLEKIFWNICTKIINMTRNDKFVPKEIKRLKYEYAQQYLCNFSVFQSTPDAWAIEQILPIVPISRLNERPSVHATLADITCDSDGSINSFVGADGIENYLPLHELKDNQDYPIGIFLTGAYQDTMGDMHNLFGRVNEVHVYSSDDNKGFYIEEVIHGQSCADVLKIMQYSPDAMCTIIKSNLEKMVKLQNCNRKDAAFLLDTYENALKDYTYLK